MWVCKYTGGSAEIAGHEIVTRVMVVLLSRENRITCRCGSCLRVEPRQVRDGWQAEGR